MEMHPPKQHSRIDLAELKALLIRKLGPIVSKQYFYHLNKFLNLNISKVDFNKICYRILGRENISLHNEFIRLILKNACSAKHPPPKHVKVTPTEIYLPNGIHNAIVPGLNSQGCSNGDILRPLSPLKARTGFRDRRSGDRFSPLGPNGKTSFASLHSIGKISRDFNAILENGVSIPDNVQELDQHLESLIPQAQDQYDVSVKQDKKDLHAGSELQAPLGLPFCSPSVGMAHKATMPSASNSGILLDNETLRERMEQIATSKGLEGVSIDCANILNKGLDAYLKGLISSCVKLVSARSGLDPINSTNTHPKLVNGVKSSHLYQAQTSSKEVSPEYRSQSLVSLQNFRVAMELNPQQLGENWPLLLEKICSLCYEEYNTLE